MSTTFAVYPQSAGIPSFEQLLRRATTELHRYLAAIGVSQRPSIHVRIQQENDLGQTIHIPFELSNPLKWDESDYAWFMVGDVPGGTDAYYRTIDQESVEDWDERLIGPRIAEFGDLRSQCLKSGRYWYFRRSAGQPGTINLAYGLLAGSLAAITSGLIISDDSAWDWRKFPATAEEFLSWYFVPELATDSKCREWSQRCIGMIRQELINV